MGGRSERSRRYVLRTRVRERQVTSLSTKESERDDNYMCEED